MRTRERIANTGLRVLGALAAALVLYAAGLPGEFVYDDYKAVVFNECVKGERPLVEVFKTDFWCSQSPETSTGSLRPLPLLWLRGIYALFDGSVAAFRAGSAILLGLVAAAFLTLCLRLGLGLLLASASAFVFVANPVFSEAVLSPAGVSDLFFALFATLFVYHRLDRRGAKRIVLPLLWFTLACFSKETAILLPVAAVLLDLLLARAEQTSAEPLFLVRFSKKGLVGFYGAVLALSVGYLLWRWLVFGKLSVVVFAADNPLAAMSTGRRTVEALSALGKAVLLILYPNGLSIDHTGCTFSIAFLLVGAIFVVSALASAFEAYRAGFVRAGIVILLLIVGFGFSSNLVVLTPTVLAERQLLLPAAAWALMLGAAGLMVKPWLEEFRILRVLPVVVLVGLAIIYAGRLQLRLLDWRTQLSVYASSAQACPRSFKLQANLGHLLRAEGKGCAAIEPLKSALELAPVSQEPAIELELALAHHLCKDFDEALTLYNRLEQEFPALAFLSDLKRSAQERRVPKTLLISVPFAPFAR